MKTREFTIQISRIDGNYKGQLERLQKDNPNWNVVFTFKHDGYMDVNIRETQLEPLAEFTTHSHDGEAWVHTKVYAKQDADGKRITRVQALDASGMEYSPDERMGQVQLATPTVMSAVGVWLIQQSGYANV
jgi:hypothetical protein